ncbi:MAG TPA: bifunctional diguanylate cyclase/phosphodiesterase [Pilimelia sp.]|nr:bifunctional diguanylate cyclase/phosphodiesterase [Pilimelia sp.]
MNAAVLPALRGRSAWLFAAAAGVGLLAYAGGGPTVRMAVFILLAAGTVAAVVSARRRYELGATAPAWWLVSGAVVAFTVGATLRAVFPLGSRLTWSAFIPDAAVVPGYLLLMAGFALVLRRRRAADNDPARADAFLIGLGATFAAWSLLVVPVLQARPHGMTLYLVGAAFPIFDVVVLSLAAQLLFADGRREPAIWLVTVASVCLLVGDLAYALHQVHGLRLLGGLQIELAFLAGFAALGTAAMHPSVVRLSEPQSVVLRRLGPARACGIAAVLLVPTIASGLVPPMNGADAAVRTVLGAALTLTVLLRIVRAHDARIHAQRAAHAAEQAERRRATHDALTDLPNRELLTEELTRWAADAQAADTRVGLLYLDLDRFKMVNDNWGHRVGDELLCAVGARLRGLVRTVDLVCRVGGDEFVVALAPPHAESLADALAQRLVEEFGRPFSLSVGEVIVTASVGVVQAGGGVDARELLRDADTAMYQAKSGGRNGFARYDARSRAATRHRVDLEQALRGALDRGELSLHYQPIVDQQRGRLDGFEALLRWEHPEYGRVSPMEFVPIAEETGLIVPIGDWILGEAAGQLARWRAARPPHAPPLHVSVNVAVRQLRCGRLVGTVSRVLADTGLPPSALWLEVTESGAMENLEDALAVLRELHRLGVTLCIDDFGTGYSSLSYLRMLPADIVKIDRSFVMGLDGTGAGEAIVPAVLAMAHALGRRVVAEGVETAEQRDRLRVLGCDLAQGYLFGAPRPADADTGWLSWPLDARTSRLLPVGA